MDKCLHASNTKARWFQADIYFPFGADYWHIHCFEIMRRKPRVSAMDNQFTLLVADRNRNVRYFLRREFLAAGYSVQLAKDDRELLAMINAGETPNLLILDLEMPYTAGTDVLAELQNSSPFMPVVVYTLLTDQATNEATQKAAAFLEKRCNNVEDLKKVVEDVLRKWYPRGPGIATRFLQTANEQSEELVAPGEPMNA